jgi:glycosyltransferase involved in cell wall biosynthesis
MNLVMTLLVRNEADIVDDQIAFHLAAGVDFVIAADNESTDGTTKILENYARKGRLYRISLPDPFSQIVVVTDMARLAATRFGADWVINSDADEFWWARAGTLKEILSAVPPRFGSVRGMWRNFVPRPGGDPWFAERMTVRSQKPIDGLHPLNPHFKTVHRASAEAEVGGGNHDVLGPGLTPLVGWYPIDVLHFRVRSLEQFERKYMRWWQITSIDGKASNPYYNFVRNAHRQGRIAQLYDSLVVDDEHVARGVADGTLVEDTRLRDALRTLRERGSLPVENDEPDVDPGYLMELGYIEDRTSVARAQRSIDDLEARLSRVEPVLTVRLSRRLARRS